MWGTADGVRRAAHDYWNTGWQTDSSQESAPERRNLEFRIDRGGKPPLVTNDVEKRWHDPRALRAAVAYVVGVLLVAVVAFTVYALRDRHDLLWAFATPGVLALGALGAFVKTYRDWRAYRTWPIWQGAGWFLMATTLLSLGIPSMGVLGR